MDVSRLIKLDFRTTRYMERTFAPDRVVLVRHGNALDDGLRRAGVEPDQKPHDSDRTKSPYVLDGKAHHPDQPDD